MEENPQPHTPEQILNADTIQNLDTARMALRWALERMHKLEQEKGALADTAAASERAKNRSQEEYAALQKTLSMRSADTDQRELYYSKLEEFLSMQLGGKLDLAALAKRELEVQQLQELLQQKEVQLGKELAAKKASLEREHHNLRTAGEQEARAKNRQVEQALEVKRASLEQDYLSRMSEVHEKEVLLKQESQALAERRTHFEDYYSKQRVELQTAIKNFKDEVEDQVNFRLEVSQRILSERYSGLEAGWTQEKVLLVRELESWRLKGQELGPKVIDLESAVALNEEFARQARAAADRQTLILEEHRRDALAEAAALQAEASHWKEKTARQLSEILELRQSVGLLEEGLRQVQSLAQNQAARFDEAQKTADAERIALANETASWRQRFEAALAKSQDEARGAAVLEEALAQARRACELQAGMIEERRLGWEEEKKVLLAELSEWKEKLADGLDEAAALEKRAAAGEAAAKQESARAQALEEQRARLETELAGARQKAAENLPRLLQLEKGLTQAEEAESAMERHLARFEVQKDSWDRERERFFAEIAAAREEGTKALPRLLELDRRLAIAEEALTQAGAAAERQSARFSEQSRGWERERAELVVQVERLKVNLPAKPSP